MPTKPMFFSAFLATSVVSATLIAFDKQVSDPSSVIPPGKVSVVCFLSTECPLAKLYAPRLVSLFNEFKLQGVTFVGVDSCVQDTAAELSEFATRLQIPFPLHLDPQQRIADHLGATRVSEVFLIDAQGEIRYRGRIDNQYEPGVARASPTEHYLQNALRSFMAGKPIAIPSTSSVGCLITRIERPKESANHEMAKPVSYFNDIAPILRRECVECHRSGEIGPFALTDYQEVIGWAEMIREVTQQDRMPPWHADPGVNPDGFVGQRRLTKEEKSLIDAWVRQGMPQGSVPVDKIQEPGLTDWERRPTGWHLETPPDVQFAMRNSPFTVPAEGTVEYQYFVVDPGWEEDRWVRAAQVIPGQPSVVHHVIVFTRPPDQGEFHGIGWLGAYVPGQRTVPLPDGYARRVAAGSKLIFQLHYTPNGSVQEDTSRLGIWFADEKEIQREVFTLVAIDQDFEIPPGKIDHEVNLRIDSFQEFDELLGVMPHMHLRGRSFRMTAVKGKQSRPLLNVPRYDFNWQHFYQFKQPLPLVDIDRLEMEVRFDNSSGNPTNPDPNAYVYWGDQTWNEMAVAFLDVSRDRRRTEFNETKPIHQPLVTADPKRVAATVEKLMVHDKNRDGILDRHELPVAFRHFGFYQFDENGNSRLEREEIENAARRQR